MQFCQYTSNIISCYVKSETQYIGSIKCVHAKAKGNRLPCQYTEDTAKKVDFQFLPLSYPSTLVLEPCRYADSSSNPQNVDFSYYNLYILNGNKPQLVNSFSNLIKENLTKVLIFDQLQSVLVRLGSPHAKVLLTKTKHFGNNCQSQMCHIVNHVFLTNLIEH